MYTLCGFNCHGWVFKCHLNMKYIGKGVLNDGFIIIKKKSGDLYFHEKCSFFNLTVMCKHKKCYGKNEGCCIQANVQILSELKCDCNRYENKDSELFNLWGTVSNNRWIFRYKNLDTHVGKGYLIDDRIIIITFMNNCLFFHNKCINIKIIERNEYRWDKLIECTGKPMIIEKYIPNTFETFKKRILITLNEPFIQQCENNFDHPDLFMNKGAKILQVATNQFGNSLSGVFQCHCNDLIKLRFNPFIQYS